MKNLSLQTIGLAFITTVSLTSCDGLAKLVKNAGKISYKVTPDPIEMHGDSISLSVSGTFPIKIFPKKATVTTTPVIKYDGGEKALKPIILIGEKLEGNGQKIKKAEGGSYTYTSEKFAYTPEMKKAVLELRVEGQVKKKVKSLPSVKIADGTVVTPLLVKSDGKGIMAKDKLVRTIQRSQSANIFFTINQSQVRPAEMKSDELKAFKEFITAGIAKSFVFKNINLSAYASPDGELTLNSSLAENRAVEAAKAMMAMFKDEKTKLDVATADAFYNKVTTAEDWDGFKKAIENSSIPDKDLILRVLTMYPNGETREKEIKNLSKTYVEVADKILPQLRRAVLTLNAEEKGRTDEEIKALATTTAEGLSIEELLFAGTLTNDLNTKLEIYKKAELKYSSDWRAFNNLGNVYLLQNKLNEAETHFKKAIELSPKNEIINNNLGIVAHSKGDRKAAMELYKSALSAGPEVNYNIGIIEIQNGNYASAISNFGNFNTFNLALAKLLNKNADGAISTIDGSTEKDAAISFYLKAICGARQNKADYITSNLKTAIQKDASFKALAKDDAEFIKFRENEEFKAIVN